MDDKKREELVRWLENKPKQAVVEIDKWENKDLKCERVELAYWFYHNNKRERVRAIENDLPTAIMICQQKENKITNG